MAAVGSNVKAEAFQQHIDAAMDTFFPIKMTRQKSSDLPWVNKAIKKKIRRRKKIDKKEGRSNII